MADSFAVGQVVSDDFSQLRKVPAVPLSAAHDVVVKLLIQVIQKSWGDNRKKWFFAICNENNIYLQPYASSLHIFWCFSYIIKNTTYRWPAQSWCPLCLDWTSACSGINWIKRKVMNKLFHMANYFWSSYAWDKTAASVVVTNAEEILQEVSDSKCNHRQQSH